MKKAVLSTRRPLSVVTARITWAALLATWLVPALPFSGAAEPGAAQPAGAAAPGDKAEESQSQGTSLPQGLLLPIDAQRSGATISPGLFGHNLEVTRRSVFGGLSAEMVSNRKFAAWDKGLPKRWTVIASSTTLASDESAPYAGRASLRVSDDGQGGLRQQVDAPLFPKASWTQSILPDDYGSDVGGLLAFQKGRKYSFRWQLKTDGQPKNLWMRVLDTSGSKILGEATLVLKPGDWQTWTGEFSAAETVDNARLEIGSKTPGYFWIGAASLQPADAFHGMRRDVIACLKEMKCSSLRFPGGCYSDFYAWRDGLLPVDERPVIHEGPLEFLLTDSDGYDTQEMGTDEFLALCQEVGCEPALTVRIGNVPGEPEEATAWVEYCNGGPETQWGQVRAQHGHAQPYGVKVWFVGNELAFFGRNGMNQAAVSVPRSRLFAEAMNRVDPSITLVGCTDFTKDGTDPWNQGLIEQAGDYLRYGSYHAYVGGIVEYPAARAMAKASVELGTACQTLSKNLHREVFLDEWNTVWGKKATVATALHAASMLNRLCRDSQELGIARAYYFQPINEGAIVVTPQEAKLDLAGKVFSLYAVHQGARLLRTPAQPADSDLDLCASLAADGQHVFVTAVNRNCDQELPLSLAVDNFSPKFTTELKMLVPRSLENTETEMLERKETLAAIDDNRIETTLPPGAIARFVLSRE